LLGIVYGLIALLLYILLTVLGVFFLLLFVWVTVYSVGWGVLYTIYLVLLTVLIAIPYFGLWMIDMPTGGLVVRMMRCEARLDSWYAQPSLADGNGFEHMLPFCMRPCPERYKPTIGGSCCGALAPHMPDYCPQQQVYRILLAGSAPWSRGPSGFVRYATPLGFSSMPYTSKRKLILAAYKDKVKWYQRCYTTLNEFDYLTRHICDNSDLLGKALNENGVEVLSLLCKDCYCDYEHGDMRTGIMANMTADGYQTDAPTPAGGSSTVADPSDPTKLRQLPAGNLSQCARLNAATVNSSANALSGEGPGSALLRRALLIGMLVLCVLIALYSMIAL
jgi:hypothetical protein